MGWALGSCNRGTTVIRDDVMPSRGEGGTAGHDHFLLQYWETGRYGLPRFAPESALRRVVHHDVGGGGYGGRKKHDVTNAILQWVPALRSVSAWCVKFVRP